MALSDPIHLTGKAAHDFVRDLEHPTSDPDRDALIRKADRMFGSH